jgi:hypothetical protein
LTSLKIAGAVALFATTVATAPLLHREKPPEGHTGGFGEPTCAQCHLWDGSDAPPAKLRLTGLPEMFEPGQRYALTVTLTSPDLQVGGFQLAARYADGPRRARQAGLFVVDGKLVGRSRVDSTGIDYVYHTLLSVGARRDTLRWHFTWTAPTRPAGAIEFNLAANVSNDDASNIGDHIFSDSIRVRPRSAK